MTRILNNHRLFIRLGQTLAIALLLGVAASAALAQGAPPNMDFTTPANSAVGFTSAGNATRGTVRGFVSGSIRNGVVARLDLVLDPVIDGGRGHITRFSLDYKVPGQITARWYTVSNGKKLVLTNVPAHEWISGYTPQPIGLGTLELTFDNNGGPGRALVSYTTHQGYGNVPSFYTRPNPVMGLICDCRPNTPNRLTYTLR